MINEQWTNGASVVVSPRKSSQFTNYLPNFLQWLMGVALEPIRTPKERRFVSQLQFNFNCRVVADRDMYWARYKPSTKSRLIISSSSFSSVSPDPVPRLSDGSIIRGSGRTSLSPQTTLLNSERDASGPSSKLSNLL